MHIPLGAAEAARWNYLYPPPAAIAVTGGRTGQSAGRPHCCKRAAAGALLPLHSVPQAQVTTSEQHNEGANFVAPEASGPPSAGAISNVL